MTRTCQYILLVALLSVASGAAKYTHLKFEHSSASEQTHHSCQSDSSHPTQPDDPRPGGKPSDLNCQFLLTLQTLGSPVVWDVPQQLKLPLVQIIQEIEYHCDKQLFVVYKPARAPPLG